MVIKRKLYKDLKIRKKAHKCINEKWIIFMCRILEFHIESYCLSAFWEANHCKFFTFEEYLCSLIVLSNWECFFLLWVVAWYKSLLTLFFFFFLPYFVLISIKHLALHFKYKFSEWNSQEILIFFSYTHLCSQNISRRLWSSIDSMNYFWCVVTFFYLVIYRGSRFVVQVCNLND